MWFENFKKFKNFKNFKNYTSWGIIGAFLFLSVKVKSDETFLWSINNTTGTLMFQNQPLLLKGINWFGYETPCRMVHGLWAREMDDFLETISDYEYNAIRLPFSLEVMETWENPPLYDCIGASSWLKDISVKDTLHIFFEKSKDLGLSILLDFHSIHEQITPYPWTDDHPTEEVLMVWEKVVEEFSMYPNLLGIDLKNEPHGDITWPLWTDFVDHVIRRITENCPSFKGLFFVEGLQENNSVWGGSFQNMPRTWSVYKDPHPRVVFSPHMYGVSVRGDIAMTDTFQQYDEWFGFLHRAHRAVVIGEVGGWYIGDDEVWEKRFMVYLKEREMTNVFYWCLNPDSVDTGGLLYNDWKTPNIKKVLFHENLQPYPTDLIF
jgi:endoglucanase